MIDFHSFETFDPNGPGLGNLFGQVSPFEALGIWPSGDFRLAPGDGAVPALGYYLGAAFALVAPRSTASSGCWRRRETAILAGLAAAALAYAAARVGGTPYTAAKAIEIAAPLVALTILLPLLHRSGASYRWHATKSSTTRGSRAAARWPVRPRRWRLLAARARQRAGRSDLLLARSSSELPQAGRRRARPWSSPRPSCSQTNTANRSSPGNCVAAGSASRLRRTEAPPGVRFVVTRDAARRRSGHPRRVALALRSGKSTDPPPGKSPCPLIAVRQARQGPAR